MPSCAARVKTRERRRTEVARPLGKLPVTLTVRLTNNSKTSQTIRHRVTIKKHARRAIIKRMGG
jgi:hypothetical protein